MNMRSASTLVVLNILMVERLGRCIQALHVQDMFQPVYFQKLNQPQAAAFNGFFHEGLAILKPSSCALAIGETHRTATRVTACATAPI